MAGRRTADVVFCLDASDSMSPCIAGVKRHISTFVSTLEEDQQGGWDVRFDFLAHQATDHDGDVALSSRSVHNIGGQTNIDALYGGGPGLWFTTDLSSFNQALDQIEIKGDEASLLALDCVLDIPWRVREDCHRVVIFMTDEPLETGLYLSESQGLLGELREKIHALKVKLFMVTPDSGGYEGLAAADKCEWEVVPGGDGLASVDFSKLLEAMAKSVSKSQTPLGGRPSIPRALFGQDSWGAGMVTWSGDRT